MLFESSGVSVAVEREEVCGDAWEVIETAGSSARDGGHGLGHGPFAGEAALKLSPSFARKQPQGGIHA
jgi:hypothetical protein